MARQSRKSPKSARKAAPVNELGWRRQPGGSKRFRNVSDPRYPVGAIISNRKMSDLEREKRFGRKVSKEEYTKKVKELSYADKATKLRQDNAKNSRFIRHLLPEITPKDKTVALKYYRTGYGGFTADEKKRFAKMYDRYPVDDVRQALGSAPRDTGSFRLAA
jgi:hypothetical protein